MTVRLLLAATVLLGLAASTPPAPAAENRPNLIFILVDDARWDSYGCVGHPFVKTPHIDRIAHEGAIFENYFVTTPLCSPSRASILTGQYDHTNGVRDNTNHNELSHKLVTFPALLHKAGYESAFLGKWHMGNDDTPRPGIDHWVSFKGQGVYNDPQLNIDGKEQKVSGYITDLLNQYAVDFVKKQRDKPFVLYLSHKAVHGPFTPAPRHKDLYADATYTPPPNVVHAEESRKGKPALPARDKGMKELMLQDGKAAVWQVPTMLNQLRCLAAIDDGVGKLFDALEESKQLDNTVIVFSSDNGYFWREHGLGDKRWAYEESIRDPLFVRYPKLVKGGTKLDQLVLNIDLAPTFLELGEAKVPADMQGHSLVPLLRGDKHWREAFLAEYFQDGKFAAKPWQAVRTQRWKYIHYPENEAWDEMYDLQADRYELKNLIHDPASQERLKELKQELAKQMKETRFTP